MLDSGYLLEIFNNIVQYISCHNSYLTIFSSLGVNVVFCDGLVKCVVICLTVSLKTLFNMTCNVRSDIAALLISNEEMQDSHAASIL